jgi:hypothetical protein
MMMGSSTITPATINEALALINAVLNPQAAKAGLEELSAATAKHEQARAAALEEQKRAATATAEVERATAALADRTAALDAREHSIANREQVLEHARSEIRRKIAGESIPA